MNKNSVIVLILFIVQISFSQNEKLEPPFYSPFRAEENYDYLKNEESNLYKKDYFDAIKYIPLSKNKDVYLTLGGQVRPRLEYYNNRLWNAKNDVNFYSQRLSLHSNVVLGQSFRVFSELYSGYSSHTKEFSQYDELNVHQMFAEFKTSLSETSKLSFRFGRQEMSFGVSRLIGIREGPNIRRSFDATRIILNHKKATFQGFYGKEVIANFGVFDNDFSLFNGNTKNAQLWGIYSQFKLLNNGAKNELYYLGSKFNNANFNDVSGKETRHSFGLRSYGKLGKRWNFNTEIIYQFGKLNTNDISAFTIETDWDYELIHTKWKSSVGLKLEYTSGDKESDDGKINTFNPLFLNPTYYSLASTITPVNLISVRPSLKAKPSKKIALYLEYGIFWRASKNDAFYIPPRIAFREAQLSNNRELGNQIGFKIEYKINRHLAFDLDTSYFIAGSFLRNSGGAENILHIAPTFSYKF